MALEFLKFKSFPEEITPPACIPFYEKAYTPYSRLFLPDRNSSGMRDGAPAESLIKR